ncbi:uncharacterized protein CG13380 [Anastrepha ludens]|uniref:uncharacterized protein CG13380 n=1 Tax=Anastrepha ludens TaxID=28586 RepID=UPI0023B16A6D|nr:uncharacterized protein CG13380 [Anastrepha ludens]
MPRRNRKKSSLSDRLDIIRKNNVSADITGTISDNDAADKSTNKSISNEMQPIPEECICQRDAKTFVCICCKMFSFGRISESCPIHPNVTYLMDFSCCPYCYGQAEHLHVVNMEYERYFKI